MCEENTKYSVTVVEKRKKLISLKKKMDNYFIVSLLFLLLFLISVLFSLNSLAFISNKVANIFISSSSTSFSSIDIRIFLMLVIGGVISYIAFTVYIGTKEKYDFIRKSLIDIIDADTCNCKSTCNCKDSLIIELKGQGIDLIFEPMKPSKKASK